MFDCLDCRWYVLILVFLCESLWLLTWNNGWLLLVAALLHLFGLCFDANLNQACKWIITVLCLVGLIVIFGIFLFPVSWYLITRWISVLRNIIFNCWFSLLAWLLPLSVGYLLRDPIICLVLLSLCITSNALFEIGSELMVIAFVGFNTH